MGEHGASDGKKVRKGSGVAVCREGVSADLAVYLMLRTGGGKTGGVKAVAFSSAARSHFYFKNIPATISCCARFSDAGSVRVHFLSTRIVRGEYVSDRERHTLKRSLFLKRTIFLGVCHRCRRDDALRKCAPKKDPDHLRKIW